MATLDHVALFIANLNGGGAERAMVNLANGLAREVARVDLVLGQATGPFLSEVARSVNIVDLGCPRISRAMIPFRRYLKEARPRVVISTLVRVNILAVLASRWLPVRPLIVLREANTPSTERARDSSRALRLTYDLARFIYPLADAVVALSDVSRDDCKSFYKLADENLYRLYNPIVDDALVARASEPFDHPWLDGGRKLVATMGRVVRQKGLDVLIDALSIVTQKHDAALLVIGDTGADAGLFADLRDQIRARGLEDRVEFIGFDSNPFRIIARTDVFVLASRWEGLPGALIQALALGVPVIATDCPGGSREVLQDGKCGRLVPVEDPQSLAEAINAVLDEGDAQADQGCLEPFILHSVVSAWRQLLERLVISNTS